MSKTTREFTPQESKIYDIINDDIGVVYLKMSEHKALNLAIYRMVDDVDDYKIDPRVRAIINNVIALLNLQEALLAALDKDVDNVVEKLSDVIHHSDKETEEAHSSE